ncbi:MAG: rhomboid family intramembrane serine protease [Candidatus Woesearchaeota archaeon]
MRGKFNSNAYLIILGLNVVVYLFQFLLGDSFTRLFYIVPGDVLSRPWTLITSMFLHGGPAHLIFNMYALLIFGGLIEQRIGSKRFVLSYLVAGIFAGGLYSIFSQSPALGASGAIMSVLGLAIMLLPDLQVLFFFVVPMSLRTAGIIFALIDVFGLFNPSSGIAHIAHLGG